MSEKSLGSFADLALRIEQLEPNAVVTVAHPAACAMAPLVADVAQRARNAGRTVVLFAPDAPSAARWRRDLAEVGLRDVPVHALREAALALIAGAGDSFPRDPRLLDANEMDILMEDLKVSGIKPRRLREMVKFLNKGMAEGSEDDPAWLISAEEQQLYALLRANLEARRALVAPEVCARALEALATAAGTAAAPGLVPDGALAIAPDFGTLSLTGQRLVRALAADGGLLALSGTLQACNAEEDYPHPAGFADLKEDADASFAVEPDAPAPVREEIVAAHPAEEFDAVADRVAAAVTAGTAPRDILVACPHRIWMEAIGMRLTERGIAAVVDEGPRKVKGDPREEARCGHLRTRALAKLLADPRDVTAWRSWLGLGDWLTRSDAFSALMAQALENGASMAEALQELSDRGAGDVAGAEGAESPLLRKLDGPLRTFTEVRGALASTSGEEVVALLEDAGCVLSDEARKMLAAEEAPDAERVAAILLADGTTEDAPDDAVTLTSYRRAFGFHGSLTIVCGLVSGFLPTCEATSDRETIEHRRRAYDRERILFEAACATASDILVLSRFEHDRIENADALSMDVARIYQENGLRFATLAPSPYLTDTTPVPCRPTVVTRADATVAL